MFNLVDTPPEIIIHKTFIRHHCQRNLQFTLSFHRGTLQGILRSQRTYFLEKLGLKKFLKIVPKQPPEEFFKKSCP